MEEETFITVRRRVTAASKEASRNNGAKSVDIVRSEEHKNKLRAAQALRRERERLEKEAAGLTKAPVVKRPAGRPRKTAPVSEPTKTP